MSAELDRAVRAVVRDCLGVASGEEVLVVCNPATEGLGALMRGEAQEVGADAVLAVISERDSHAAEPPGPVAAAMAAADVVLAPTVQSLSHTAARKAASEAGVRIATLPGVTEEMLARVMGADMSALRRRGAAVAAALDAGDEARITCAHGSDLRLGLAGRTAISDAGELGIGTNERAILTGNILEDEKILGTAHVAFGASAAIGGTVQVPVHLDCVVLEPTVEIDGEAIVRGGELLL